MNDLPVTLLDYLNRARAFLARHPGDSPRLEAEVLLAFVLGCSRIDLYTSFDRPLSGSDVDRYRALVLERARGIPVAYLTGQREFYSLPFRVTPAVLVPRPETEHLVEAALAVFPPDTPVRVLDVGTGSGCVAITVARHCPRAFVVATDVSAAALAVAADNARRLDVADRVALVQADLLRGITPAGGFHVIVSNPPYIPTGDRSALLRDVRDHEPRVALFGGPEGTEIHRRLVADAPRCLARGGTLCLEIGAGQEAAVRRLMESGFDEVSVGHDLAGHARVITGKIL